MSTRFLSNTENVFGNSQIIVLSISKKPKFLLHAKKGSAVYNEGVALRCMSALISKTWWNYLQMKTTLYIWLETLFFELGIIQGPGMMESSQLVLT